MSAILGQLGRLGTLGVASTGGFSLVAIRSRFVAAGMASLYLPYAADAAYSVYYGDGLLTSVGGVIGLIVDQLPTDRLGVERFNIANATNVNSNVTINQGAGTLTHTDTLTGGSSFSGAVGTEYGWSVGYLVNVVMTISGLTAGSAGSFGCFAGEPDSARLLTTSRTTDRVLMVTLTSGSIRLSFISPAPSGAVISGISVRRLQGYHLRQVNESPRPSLARSAGGVLYYNFPAGTSISPTVSIGSAGAGAMLVAVPGGAPQWYTGLTITSSFAISATHAPSGAAAIALFPSLPDAATRAWLEPIFTKIGMGVRI